jgi:osmoprotectant transport system permease protein
MNLVSETVAWLTDPAHWAGATGIAARLGEHVLLSAVSLAIALAIALPIGIWIGHTGRFASAAVNLANVWRALPSLALIGIVLPITAAIDPQLGFRVYPTLIAMIALAIPPILVNTQAGIAGVDRELVEAARAMGMREAEVIRKVELPLSLPAILSGIRSAAVQVVATLTLGAIFGSGGLGRYLVEGIAQRNDGMTFGGVVLVAALALAVEGGFVLLLRLIRSPGLQRIQQVSAAPSRA